MNVNGNPDVMEGASFNGLAVAGEVAVYTNHFKLPRYSDMTVVYQFDGTDINVKIELEQGDEIPEHANAASANYAVASDVGGAIETGLTTGVLKRKAVRADVSRFARFKITGLTGNTSDVEALKLYMIWARRE